MQNRVKQVIESKAFTSSRFADHIGVPRATISHILSGRNKPSLEVVQKILDAFPDISAEWLVKGKGMLGKTAPSLFELDDFSGNLQKPAESHSSKKDSLDKPLEDPKNAVKEAEKKKDNEKVTFHPPDRSESAILNTKTQEQTAPSATRGAEIKKSVKIIVMYADGTYSEHLPSV